MVGDILKKCNTWRLAVCKLCDCEISYGYGSSKVFARHIGGAKHQAKFKVFMETKKMCVYNLVTVSNYLKSMTPMAANFEAGLIFLIDQYKFGYGYLTSCWSNHFNSI